VPAGTDRGRERDGHIVSVMNTSRVPHNSDSTQWCSGKPVRFDKGFKESILNVYWTKKHKTGVYLAEHSQTASLCQCPLEEKLDLICDQLRILLLQAGGILQ